MAVALESAGHRALDRAADTASEQMRPMSHPTRDDAIHIVFAADGRYAMPLAVAICSAAANCDRKRRLVFSVIQSGIGPDLRSRVESSLARVGFPNARIDWLELQAGALADLKIVHHYMTPLIYARLLIPDLLPLDVEKVLYLDSDIVVNDDLGELWDTDVDRKALFAVRDRLGFVSSPGGLLNHRELGIPEDAKYFNSGVLLMNLKRWREHDISKRIFSHLTTYRDTIQMGDQDGLNAVLFDDWGELEFRWNWQILPSKNWLGIQPCWAPDSERQSLIHFVTSEKPWLPACAYEERKYFFQTLDRTAWAGWRVPLWKEAYVRLKRAIRTAQGAVARRLRP